MASISDLAQAVARGEGYGANPNNRPTRLNNPGDLTGTGYPGQVGVDPQGFAIFSSPSAGYSALQGYLSQHLSAIAGGGGAGAYSSLTPNSTLQDFLNIYAGSPDSGYLSTVAGGVGASPSTPLGQLAGLLGLSSAPGGSQTTPAHPGGAPSPSSNSVEGILAGIDGATFPPGVSPVLLAIGAAAAGLVAYALLS